MQETQVKTEIPKELYQCPIDAAVQIISGKWKIIILWKLYEKPMRFGELKRSVVGITEKMLIQQLRELGHHKIIDRKDFQEIPLRVEYSLSERGQTLKPALDALWQWGQDYVQRDHQEDLTY